MKHGNFIVIQCLILDPEFPFMGARPDGLVNCKCCAIVVFDMRCPLSCKRKGFTIAASENPSVLLLMTRGKFCQFYQWGRFCFHGFNPMEYLAGTLLWCIGQECLTYG